MRGITKGGLLSHERVFFDYWITMFELLAIGIPWDAIDKLSPMDMSYILAFHMARKEREHEVQAEQEAKAYSNYPT